MKVTTFVFCVLLCLPLAYTILDDTVLYNLNWPGRAVELTQPASQQYIEEEAVIMQTTNNEKYKCTIPHSTKDKNKEEDFQDSISPIELLSPILAKKPCTYRLEAYWTYEICHGKHIRQYHEEKAAGGSINVQEYFLGYFTEKPDDEGVYSALGNVPQKAEDIPMKKIDGVLTPYYAIKMKNGTPCELKGGETRKSQVLYVCQPESRNGIMSFSETSSCEYELIIHTPVLCQNPFYKVKGSQVNEIYCTPLDDSPSRPKALEELQQMDPALRQIAPSLKSDEVEIELDSTKNDYRRADDADISTQTDKALLRDFLAGDFCLQGSSGWWSYEFCYGKHVKQFHDDKTLGRTIIMVGLWDEVAHKEWVKKKKSARIYKEEVNAITNKKEKKVIMVEHFYHRGDFCEAAGKPREVVVKLKCRQSSSKHAVTIYLREPATCSYILGVESPIICDLLDTADENGLFNVDP